MDENTNPTNPINEPEEKTFTQAEVDKIVSARVARATKGMPSAEELTAYNAWKANQQTEAEKLHSAITERDNARAESATAKAEAESLKRALYIAKKGLEGEDAEFIAYKAEKMVSDTKTFEQSVDELTKDRKEKARFDWAAQVGGGEGGKKYTENDVMNAFIRGARR